MPDAELQALIDEAKPWLQDILLLSRYFGLRKSECCKVTVAHVAHNQQALRFDAKEVKGKEDQFAYPLNEDGWQLVLRLFAQAKARGQKHLITRPATVKAMITHAKGVALRREDWTPVKSVKSALRGARARAAIEDGHRLHDVRARYITNVARVTNGDTILVKRAARHKQITTSEAYVGIEDEGLQKALRGTKVNIEVKPALKAVRR